MQRITTKGKISIESEYKSVMERIDKLMSKGSQNVSKAELAEIRKLALQAQQYERDQFGIDPTISGNRENK